MIEPLAVIWLIAIPVVVLTAATIAFLLCWVVLLSVRSGLRDHHTWLGESTPTRTPNI